MRETNLGQISLLHFGPKTILCIDEGWNKFFKSEPVFEAVIDKDGRIVLRGPKLNLNPHRDHPAAKQENIADG